MENVKCLIYRAPGRPEFIYFEKQHPEPNEVGIRVMASSLFNTSELRSFTGGYGNGYGSSYPMNPGEPGHEAMGIVETTGNRVTEFSPGDIVAMTGHGGDPCHRSYVIRKEGDIALVSSADGIPEEAAMLEMYGCAYHCAVSPGGFEFFNGKRVLVIGLGSMGLCTVQILGCTCDAEITASDISRDRLEIAGMCGADELTEPDGITGDKQYDIVIECSGSVRGQEKALAIAPKTLIFSSYSTKEITFRQNLLFDSNTTIYNPGILTSENFRKAVALYNAGKIDPSILVTGRINAAVDEYMEAIADIRKGNTIKTLMKW